MHACTLAHAQFEQAATEILKEHYANTEEGADQEVQPVQIMLNSSSPLVQSKSRSIRDLAVGAGAGLGMWDRGRYGHGGGARRSNLATGVRIWGMGHEGARGRRMRA